MKDNRISILLGVTLSEMGGAQKVVYDIIETLPENLFEVTLVTYPGGELIQWIRSLNKQRDSKVEVITIESLRRKISPLNDLKTLVSLYKIIKVGNYDITHFHSSKMGIIGRWAAWLARSPKILFTVHGWGINSYQSWILQKLLALVERITKNLCHHIICVSKQHQDIGIKNRWINPEETTLIYNGISPPPNIKMKLRRELNIDSGVVVIGTIMRLRPPKDPLFTIKVFHKLKGENPSYNIKLVIIGGGPLRKKCEGLIEELGLNKDVYLLGSRTDARELLNDMDVITLFSRWEGLPLVIMEGMFGGKPIIASNVGGISELINHGKTGYLLEDFDVDKAVGLIKDLIDNRETMSTIGERGLEIAYKYFTKERMVEEYQDIYERIN